MKKGISPIIAVIILLLIVVAIAGSAYTYIVGYYSGLTANAIELTSVTCSNGVVSMIVHNMGTAVIPNQSWTTSAERIQGTNTSFSATFTDPAADIPIDGVGTFSYTCAVGNICKGRIIVSRSVAEAQINC